MGKPTELLELRKDIDDVDRQILDLLRRRVEIVMAVGNIKRERKIEVYDPERERALLERLGELAVSPLAPSTARRVFERIVDECRRLEQRHVNEPAEQQR